MQHMQLKYLREQYSVFEEDFLEFFPLIVDFLEEKYQDFHQRNESVIIPDS